MPIKTIQVVLLFLFLLLISSCIVPYKPQTSESEELIVIEGFITDQPGIYTIRLSRSLPLWNRKVAKPLKGSIVSISDDLGQFFYLKEIKAGTYVTDPAKFRGTIGRRYILHVMTTDSINLNYESLPMEMKPVPPIDSIYYEKRVYQTWPETVEGCQIFLDTHDPANNCKFFRWDYSETWEFHLPFDVPKRVCWISGKSDGIFVKNASFLAESMIIKHPVFSIKNPIDRLSVKYSMLVNQFSLNEEEFLYWERLKNTIDQVGGLYDIIPAAIPNNIYCLEYPDIKVLGYFGVSAISSKRIFIKDTFEGFDTQYMNCVTDTIYGNAPIPGINIYVWVIRDNPLEIPRRRFVTDEPRCADCTTRGTNIKPPFWDDGK